jgi:hypothetical protein
VGVAVLLDGGERVALGRFTRDLGWVSHQHGSDHPNVGGRDMTAWRWRCPNGHTRWRPAGRGYECKSCGEKFGELRDAKEGVSA